MYNVCICTCIIHCAYVHELQSRQGFCTTSFYNVTDFIDQVGSESFHDDQLQFKEDVHKSDKKEDLDHQKGSI